MLYLNSNCLRFSVSILLLLSGLAEWLGKAVLVCTCWPTLLAVSRPSRVDRTMRCYRAAVLGRGQRSIAWGKRALKLKTAEVAGRLACTANLARTPVAKRLLRRVLEWRGSPDTHAHTHGETAPPPSRKVSLSGEENTQRDGIFGLETFCFGAEERDKQKHWRSLPYPGSVTCVLGAAAWSAEAPVDVYICETHISRP